MNATREAIESGRQRGFVKSVKVDGEIHNGLDAIDAAFKLPCRRLECS